MAGPGLLCGVDLSEHQGRVDFAALVPHIDFAIVRGGDGVYRDRRQLEYVRALADHGVRQDVYHFMRLVMPPAAAAMEAEASWQRASDACGGAVGRLWLDMEDTSAAAQAMKPGARGQWLHEVVDRLVAVAPLGIYTGAWWWAPYMAQSQEFTELPLWLAMYPAGLTTFEDALRASPSARSFGVGDWRWSVWQFTSAGQLPGITENTVDLNVAYGEVMEMAMPEQLAAVEAQLEALASAVRQLRQEVAALPHGGPGPILSFLRAENGSMVYALVMAAGRLWLRAVPDPETFLAMGGSWENVRQVKPMVVAALPQGKPIPSVRA